MFGKLIANIVEVSICAPHKREERCLSQEGTSIMNLVSICAPHKREER